MAYTTINKSTDNFNIKLYTGTGSSNAITGIGFAPDWLWIKSRGLARSNQLVDKVRGSTKMLASDNDSAEFTAADRVASLDSDGFTLGSNDNVNGSSDTLVSWNWKAGNSSGSTNNDGATASTVSVNTAAGFSIVKWTGTSNTTIGHGLGQKPAMIICKSRSNASTPWLVWHQKLTGGDEEDRYIILNTSDAQSTYSNYWGTGGFTNQVFGVSANNLNNNIGDMIGYVFAEKTGYSKFGSYVGNANNDGTFVYTGFKPSWVMLKQASGAADDWAIYDTTRQPNNEMDTLLRPDTSAVEYDGGSGRALDILSNGFKLRTSNSTFNEGETYIYMAFGQSLVGSNNVPCTAR